MNVDAVGQRVEDLLDQIAARDEVAAELTEDLIRELMALYGAGLGRVLERIAALDPAAPQDLAADPLVGGLLVLHDLHPDDVGLRIEAALEEVRPYLASHGGGVQLLGVADGVAHLQLEGACDGCGSSQVTLQSAVEGAVLEAAPEIARIEVEGAVPATAPGLIPAGSLSLRPRPTTWESVTVPADDAGGRAWALVVGGARLAVVRLGEELFAYRDRCRACEGSLDGAPVTGDVVTCAACGAAFDARRAGRREGGGPGLEPVPLLADDAGVRVAVGAAS